MPYSFELLRYAVAQAAATDDYVLVRGESGTGKELTANAIHAGSARAKQPFVSHNASNATLTLLESTLFGNVAHYPSRGDPARKGLFGEADRGTLFFDEIGDMPMEMQTQLLRVLDSGECRQLGADAARRVNVRVIGATNEDGGMFRPDFRARFGLTVRIPPLRERREDIPLLIKHWLLRRADKYPEIGARFMRVGPHGREPRISGRLVDYLVRHPLQRNVRELNELLLQALNASVEHNEVKLSPSMRAASLPAWNTSTSPP